MPPFTFNAVLKFGSDQFNTGIDKAGKKWNNYMKIVDKAKKQMADIGSGFQSATLAAAPMAAGVMYATKQYQDFEFQMKTVQALMLETNEGMKPLNDTVKLLGATTQFSAVQVGQAAEYLAQSGFTVEQSMQALPGMLDAAAASGMDLAETTNIVVGQMGAFGLEAKDATKIADALAYASVATNTNMRELGEALNYAGPFARQAGMSLEDTASAMGIMANAGIKGSVAGTAMKNAILQLANPTKEALALFGGRGGLNDAVMETVNVGGKMVTRLKPMEVIMANVNKIVAKASDPLDAAGKAAELFGLRGSTAFSAFQGQLTKTIPITEKNRAMMEKGAKAVGENFDQYLKDGAIPSLVALRFQMQATEGTAARMREIKFDSLSMQMEQLQGATEGLGIEVGEVFAGSFKELAISAADGLSLLVAGFQAAKNGGKVTESQMKALEGNQFLDFLPTAIEFAQGFIQGFKEATLAIKETFQTLAAGWNAVFPGQELNAKQLGIFVAKMMTFATIALPILGAIAAGFYVIGPIIMGAVSSFKLMWTVAQLLWPILVGVWKVAVFIGTAFSATAALVVAAIALIAAVIYSVVQNWDALVAAFSDGRIMDGFKILGKGILDFFLWPLTKVKSMIGSITDMMGITGGEGVKVNHVVTTQDRTMQAQNNELMGLSTEQKTLVQPPSAQAISEAAIPMAAPSAGGGAGGKTDITNKIELSFKGDAGKIFNKMVTADQVENSERNGRSMPPGEKRRLLQNGATAR